MTHTPCLAEYLRATPRTALDRAERTQLAAEQAWSAAHADIASRLDRLVGERVKAVRDRYSFDGHLRFECGKSYRVVARWYDRLIVQKFDETPMSVRVEWVARDNATEATA